MLEIKGLTKEFAERRVVDNLCFSVERGEVLGFLGPNGAGKSTSMKMITGFLTPTSGTATVLGHDILTDPLAAKSAMGYLPEGAPGYDDMTVEQFLLFIGRIRGLRGADLGRRLDEVTDLVHVREVSGQRIDTLSKGYRRRVGLAQAIIHDPEVLILDEPTDGLDPNQKQEVRDLICAMAERKIIVISTHILEEVQAVCTRAIIIANGRLLADGTPEQLAARSRHHGAVAIQAAGLDAAALQSVPGVASVETEGQTLVALPGADTDAQTLLGAIQQAARERQWQIAHLAPMQGRLDDVFRNITQGTRT